MLFETFLTTTRRANHEGGKNFFFIFSGHNPLKSPDFGKINASKCKQIY